MSAKKAILVAVDVSADHDRTELFREAELRAKDGGRLVVLTVVPELYMGTATDPKGTIAGMEAHAKSELSAIMKMSPIPYAETRVAYGPVAGVILDVAKEIDAGSILIHARRPGRAIYALGSVASRVANHADASVLVIRG